jgi:hypothetical protein
MITEPVIMDVAELFRLVDAGQPKAKKHSVSAHIRFLANAYCQHLLFLENHCGYCYRDQETDDFLDELGHMLDAAIKRKGRRYNSFAFTGFAASNLV